MILHPTGDMDFLYDLASGVLEATGAGADVFVPHPGDLAWWACYLEAGKDVANGSSRVIGSADAPDGWAFVSAEDGTLDAFAFPGRDAARFESYDEGLEVLRAAGASSCAITWIADSDAAGNEWASSRGFSRGDAGYLRMSRALESGELPEPPGGFRLGVVEPGRLERAAAEAVAGLPVFGLRSRALAQRSAFESNRAEAAYIQRFALFEESSAWGRAIECAAGVPGGSGYPSEEVDAFARVWLDTRSRVALLEPVGTRVPRQGLGLGRLVAEGALALAYRAGMRSVRVVPGSSDERAVAFYRALGFEETGFMPARTKALS